MKRHQHNIENLKKIAQALEDVDQRVVYVGGCVVGLIVSDPLAPEIRVTQDVDIVVEISSRKQYDQFADILRGKGFSEDIDSQILCRWKYKDCIVDVMPVDQKILGFSNRWYPEALNTAVSLQIDQKRSVKVVSAPCFIATKLEAFKGRGNGDYLMSADIEDIVAILDGRPELLDEVSKSSSELRAYLAKETKQLLSTPGFMQNIGSFLPGDSASQARVPRVIGVMKEISILG